MQLGEGWRRGRCSWDRDGVEEDAVGTEMAERKMQLGQGWRGGRCSWDYWDGSAHMMRTAESEHYDSDEDNHKRRASILTLESNKQRGKKGE